MFLHHLSLKRIESLSSTKSKQVCCLRTGWLFWGYNQSPPGGARLVVSVGSPRCSVQTGRGRNEPQGSGCTEGPSLAAHGWSCFLLEWAAVRGPAVALGGLPLVALLPGCLSLSTTGIVPRGVCQRIAGAQPEAGHSPSLGSQEWLTAVSRESPQLGQPWGVGRGLPVGRALLQHGHTGPAPVSG